MSINTSQGKFPPPPGLFASLMAGFDSVATHIALILPPLLLDLFLWLGPHLHLKNFLQPVIDQLPSMAKAFPANFPDVATIQAAWTGIANQFNLFIVLRTFPVGITSLLGFEMPVSNPSGSSCQPGCRHLRGDPRLGAAPALHRLEHRRCLLLLCLPRGA